MMPLMATAAQFWSPQFVAAAGVLFLAGRLVCWQGHVQQPGKRALGNILTVLAIGLCFLATVAGLVKPAF